VAAVGEPPRRLVYVPSRAARARIGIEVVSADEKLHGGGTTEAD
jgi:hypothetical protein